MFQNTYGFGRDSAKADKELGDFKNMFFNAEAGAAAAPMEVRMAAMYWRGHFQLAKQLVLLHQPQQQQHSMQQGEMAV